MSNVFVRGIAALAIGMASTGVLMGQVIMQGTPIHSTPLNQPPAPSYGTPIYGTPIQGTPIYGAPVQSTPIYGTPIQSSPAPVHSSGCSHPHDPCNWSSGDDCNCDCKVCLDCYHIHMSSYCKQVDCKTTDLDYKPIGKIPTINDKNGNCYKRHWDFSAPVEVPYIVCKEEKCVEIDKRPFTCLPGCEFTLCVPVKECVEKEITCELRKKEMDIRIYERVQDKHVSYDVYVLNADSGPKHAGGMPKRWVIFHCATVEQIKAKLPNIKLTEKSNRKGTKIAAGDTSHPNPDAFKPIQIRYSKKTVKETVKKAPELKKQPAVATKQAEKPSKPVVANKKNASKKVQKQDAPAGQVAQSLSQPSKLVSAVSSSTKPAIKN